MNKFYTHNKLTPIINVSGFMTTGDNLSVSIISKPNNSEYISAVTIDGAAVTEVTIENILHEYSTIEGVQEDVLEILLNIKKLALVLPSKDTLDITLRKKGVGPVLASDISDNPDLEIKNPDFCIANITNDKTELVINMTVTKGRGYQQAQKRKFNELDDLGIGKMQLDASFSPVIQVTYNVETARVKQRTDLDKLVIDLKTNEHIS